MSKLTHTQSIFHFSDSTGATYQVTFTPQKYEDPRYTCRVVVYKDGKEIGAFRSGQYANKSNAKAFIDQSI